jgi:hypothetical protein
VAARWLWVLATAAHLAAGPVLHVDRPVLDLGALTPLSSRQLQFQVENTGDAPLRILDIQPDCGCTTCTIGTRVLLPGDTTLLAVHLDAGPAEGPFQKHITLTTNAAGGATGTATLDLVLSGEVRSLVEVSPPVLNFGELSRSEDQATRTLQLSSRLPLAIAVKEPPGETVFTWFVTTEDPRRADLNVSLDPGTYPSGKRSGHLTLRIETGLKDQPILEVPMFWSLTTPFLIDRDALTLTPRLRQGTVTLRRADRTDFTITGITQSGDLVVTGNLDEPTSSFRATIRHQGPFPEKTTTVSVGFLTNDPDEPTVWTQVTLAGTAGPREP